MGTKTKTKETTFPREMGLTTKGEIKPVVDANTKSLNKAAAMPLVKESVAEFIKAEAESTKVLEGGLWGVVTKAHECRFKYLLDEKSVKEMYRDELQDKVPAEVVKNKTYNVNKAIRIAFAKTESEVAADRKYKDFPAIYSECTTRKNIRKATNTSQKDVRNKASDNGEEPKTGWNRYEEEQKEEEAKQRSAETGSLNAVVIRMISDNRLTPQMMVRAVSTYIAEDLDATKEVICSLLEENEWAHEVASKFCKENPFSERDR